MDVLRAKKFGTIVSNVLDMPVERIALDGSRDTLEQWDSVKHMHLMLTLEEEFNIQFSDQELRDLATIKEILETVSRKAGFAISLV